MKTVNIFEAKTTFSKLVETIESGKEQEIVIARHGRPVAKLTSLGPLGTGKRIGVAKGHFEVPDDIDGHNDEIERMFSGSGE